MSYIWYQALLTLFILIPSDNFVFTTTLLKICFDPPPISRIPRAANENCLPGPGLFSRLHIPNPFPSKYWTAYDLDNISVHISKPFVRLRLKQFIVLVLRKCDCLGIIITLEKAVICWIKCSVGTVVNWYVTWLAVTTIWAWITWQVCLLCRLFCFFHLHLAIDYCVSCYYEGNRNVKCREIRVGLCLVTPIVTQIRR